MYHVIFEPHPDDVFLSMGWWLMNEIKTNKISVEIVTVFCNTKRGVEAGEYANRIGANAICMYNEENKMNLEFDKIDYKPIYQQIKTYIDFYNKECNNKVTYYFPLGLQHPDHIALRHASSFVSKWQYKAYIDTPYQAKKKNHVDLNTKLKGMEIEAMIFPPKKKWDLASIYKSQSLFFHYNAYLKESKIPEMILKPI